MYGRGGDGNKSRTDSLGLVAHRAGVLRIFAEKDCRAVEPVGNVLSISFGVTMLI